MGFNFRFQNEIMSTVVGGVSALDTPGLNLKSVEEAKQFILAYGFDLNQPEHREEIWSIHRRAVAMIKDELLEESESLPAEVVDAQKLGVIENLLLIASQQQPGHRPLQHWACAILRVMHVYVHLRNDLFSAFSEEIQSQVLRPIQEAIVTDPASEGVTLGRASQSEVIRLHKFEIKPFKTTASSVIKLLARPERVALTLLDKLGVRFVTKSVFDSFRVIRFLVDNHIVSYPHIIPDQSNNTIFPLNLFMEAMEDISVRKKLHGDSMSQEQVQSFIEAKFNEARERAEYLEKANEFSGHEYRFIKFINRKLVTVDVGHGAMERHFRFFYPYEIQIMDYNTYIRNLSGPMAHDEYKRRQRRRARERVFGAELT